MSDPRYVIVDLADYSMMMPAKRTNLPDAEHIHITRHPDGTIKSAVPMRLDHAAEEYDSDGELWIVPLWVDGPDE